MLTLLTDFLISNLRSTLACPWLNTNLITVWISDGNEKFGFWKNNSSNRSFFWSKIPIYLTFGYSYCIYYRMLFQKLRDWWFWERPDAAEELSPFILTHFSPMSHFYTPWKRQKTMKWLIGDNEQLHFWPMVKLKDFSLKPSVIRQW